MHLISGWWWLPELMLLTWHFAWQMTMNCVGTGSRTYQLQMCYSGVKMWWSNRDMHFLLWKVRLHRPIEANPLSRWISLSRKHYPQVIFYIFRQQKHYPKVIFYIFRQQHYWFCVPCSWNRIHALFSVGKFNVWLMFLCDMKVWMFCSLIQGQDNQCAYTEIMMITTIVWNAHLHKHRD